MARHTVDGKETLYHLERMVDDVAGMSSADGRLRRVRGFIQKYSSGLDVIVALLSPSAAGATPLDARTALRALCAVLKTDHARCMEHLDKYRCAASAPQALDSPHGLLPAQRRRLHGGAPVSVLKRA